MSFFLEVEFCRVCVCICVVTKPVPNLFQFFFHNVPFIFIYIYISIYKGSSFLNLRRAGPTCAHDQPSKKHRANAKIFRRTAKSSGERWPQISSKPSTKHTHIYKKYACHEKCKYRDLLCDWSGAKDFARTTLTRVPTKQDSLFCSALLLDTLACDNCDALV